MADAKISALVAATTPLAGTEVVPVVQSSSTKNVSIANLTAGRAVSFKQVFAAYDSGAAGGIGAHTLELASLTTPGKNLVGGYDLAYGAYLQAVNFGVAYEDLVLQPMAGNVKVQTGNFVPVAAGKGVNFTANTPAAGMTSQLLNWYEEGTWTPTCSTPNITVSAINSAFYTRTGRKVSGYTFLTLTNSTGSNITGVSILGLPFICNQGFGFAVEYYSNAAGSNTYSSNNYVNNGASELSLGGVLATPGTSTHMFYFDYFV